MKALAIAATGMSAQQSNVEVIANNIANMKTTAFKRMRLETADLSYQSLKRQGVTNTEGGNVIPAGVEIGLGVKPVAVTRNISQGNIELTNNPLDIALEGKGYLVVDLPDGTQAYTRAGNLQRNGDGLIVTNDGYQVSPGITIPENTREIVINRDGEVIVMVEAENEPQNLGRLQLASFVNEVGLQALGDNLFKETEASGAAQEVFAGEAGYASIRQHYVETSNVDSVMEITNLITAQRAYELNGKSIETVDQMAQTVSRMK